MHTCYSMLPFPCSAPRSSRRLPAARMDTEHTGLSLVNSEHEIVSPPPPPPCILSPEHRAHLLANKQCV